MKKPRAAYKPIVAHAADGFNMKEANFCIVTCENNRNRRETALPARGSTLQLKGDLPSATRESRGAGGRGFILLHPSARRNNRNRRETTFPARGSTPQPKGDHPSASRESRGAKPLWQRCRRRSLLPCAVPNSSRESGNSPPRATPALPPRKRRNSR